MSSPSSDTPPNSTSQGAVDEQIQTLFAELWRNYASLTPVAAKVHALLQGEGRPVANDHIALRTFDDPRIGLDFLATAFLELGYRPTGDYDFARKKLRARSYSHPSGRHPRVFISELLCGEFDTGLRMLAKALVDEISPGDLAAGARHMLTLPQTWPVPNYQDYLALLANSEYAAWLSAFGIRANHFTVSVNALPVFGDLVELNQFLKTKGFRLNGEPNPIQGDYRTRLEQSSTVAEPVQWTFAGGERHAIPSCYYEFALRHPNEDGSLFDGFVTQSANKIFESTDTTHHS